MPLWDEQQEASKPTLAPITLHEGRRFIRENHRHSKAPRVWICGVALKLGDEIVGVACLERPKAAGNCDGSTAEITRVCVVNLRNGCSMLYGAMCRAAKALGYSRVVTYTLASETGSSLLASGFRRVSVTASGHAKHWRETPNRTPWFDFAVDQEPVRRERWERIL